MAQLKLAMAIKLIYLTLVITFVLTEGLGFDQTFVKNYGHFGLSTPEPKIFYLKWRQMLIIMQLPILKKTLFFKSGISNS